MKNYSNLAREKLAGTKNWQEFHALCETLPAKSSDGLNKGDLFELLCQLMLMRHPTYRATLEHVWHCKDLPAKTREHLKLPNTDEGVDLIVQSKTGDFWAVQCKYRGNQTRAVTRKEISTFAHLAFSVANGISFGLVAHSSAKNIRKMDLLPGISELGLSFFSSIPDVEWVRYVSAEEMAKPKPRKARPHQKRAIKEITNYFLNHDRGKAIMPCGTGKSLTAYWICKALDSELTFVAVPSLYLIGQCLSDWAKESFATSSNTNFLLVCSDSTASKKSDEFVSRVSDLGLPVSTNIEVIKDFLTTTKSGRKVVFTTYHSSVLLAQASHETRVQFDLGIFDEAHRTVGNNYSSFSSLLFEDRISVNKRLFMTATERVVKTGDEVVSMDDEALYGGVAHQLSFKSAIDASPKIISDYQIVSVAIEEESLNQNLSENLLIELIQQEHSTSSVVSAIALFKAIKEKDLTKVISFHSSIAAAAKFADLCKRLQPYFDNEFAISTVSSNLNAGKRDEVLKNFADTTTGAIITNARCLQEGVDVPAVDCVLFADPKHSIVDIVQSAGRALRTSPNKERGYVLIPIAIPAGTGFLEFAKTTSFKTIGKIVTALSTQDERIIEELRAGSDKKVSQTSIFEFLNVTNTEKVQIDLLNDQIALQYWERVGRANYRSFEKARSYARSLQLNTFDEWAALGKASKLPADVPVTAHTVYRNSGWKGWGDFLGTGRRTKRFDYLPFEEAHLRIKELGFTSGRQYREADMRGMLPEGCPSSPDAYYKNSGWISWGHFLGTDRVANFNIKWRPFEEARAIVRARKISTWNEYRELLRAGELPSDLPVNPSTSYKNDGWINAYDWFGKFDPADYLDFETARAIAQQHQFKEFKDYQKAVQDEKLPKNMPRHPHVTYKNSGWKGAKDFLGTGPIRYANDSFLPFYQARAAVHALRIKSEPAWAEYKKTHQLPPGVPRTPHKIYAKQGWISWTDWLGPANPNYRKEPKQEKLLPRLVSYAEAKEYAQKLGLKSKTEWDKLTKARKHPKGIPAKPDSKYQNTDEWEGWGIFLGTGRPASFDISFYELRAYVSALNFKSTKEFTEFVKTDSYPSHYPKQPQAKYENTGEWTWWPHFLGHTELLAKPDYLTFEGARSFARSLNLKSSMEWQTYVKSAEHFPYDVPKAPAAYYKNSGWISWADFLKSTPDNQWVRVDE